MSLKPKNGLGLARSTSGSMCLITLIWSSPPIEAKTALLAGSANAAITSLARSRGDAPMIRVVGYSRGSRPKTVRSRSSPRSCTQGNRAATPEDGDSTAT